MMTENQHAATPGGPGRLRASGAQARGRPAGEGRGSETGARLALPCDPRAPRAARRALADIVGRAGIDGDVRESAVLLVSELVTNSVRHSGLGADGRVELSVAVGRSLRVEVTDGGPGPAPELVDRGSDGDGGRGLHIVSRAASRWGIDRGRVWFELDLLPATPASVQPRGG